MKQLSLSAVTLCIVATAMMLILSGQAEAESPKARFASMKDALLHARHSPGDENGPGMGFGTIQFDGLDTSRGVPVAWIVVDGALVEVPYSFHVGTGSDPGTQPPPKASASLLSIKLDANAYKSIDFGKNHDNLVFSQAGKPNRIVVTLDHSSNIPTTITLEYKVGDRWSTARRILLSPPSSK